MAITVKIRYLRIAPRKVRLIADLIRGKSVEEAQTILNFTVKNSAIYLLNLLNSAAASAKNNYQLDPTNFFISKITVDEGPKYKKWKPRARGQVSEIQKKTSHVTLVLKEKQNLTKRIKKTKKTLPELNKEVRIEKPSKPRPKIEVPKPKVEKGIKRVFRRKAF